MDEIGVQEEVDEEAAAIQQDAFERTYENEQSWEQLQEDEFGRLISLDNTDEQRAKRRRLNAVALTAKVRKGMIRYLLLVLDLSQAAGVQDFRPNRLNVMLSICKGFIREFFDQNPLSNLGIIIMRNGIAEKLTEPSGSPEAQISRLTTNSLRIGGDASLQNVLDLGIATLSNVPPYGHRELLILFAALSTCDPGNIFESVAKCKEQHIRVSVVGVAAEVHVCHKISSATGGTYGVALNESHLAELMTAHAPPPATRTHETKSELVKMGFPRRTGEDVAAVVFVGPECRLSSSTYSCPRCKAHVAELPCQCHICNLTLISSAHLARSYHHLFPVPPFDEVEPSSLWQGSNGSHLSNGQIDKSGTVHCFGCMKILSGQEEKDKSSDLGAQMILRCPRCKCVFCFDCDVFVHESLHNCPGCECTDAPTSSL